MVYNYTRVLCQYAAFVAEFTDAWDGECDVLYWKIFMLYFYAERTKYL